MNAKLNLGEITALAVDLGFLVPLDAENIERRDAVGTMKALRKALDLFDL